MNERVGEVAKDVTDYVVGDPLGFLGLLLPHEPGSYMLHDLKLGLT